jgi:hypothetical protein
MTLPPKEAAYRLKAVSQALHDAAMNESARFSGDIQQSLTRFNRDMQNVNASCLERGRQAWHQFITGEGKRLPFSSDEVELLSLWMEGRVVPIPDKFRFPVMKDEADSPGPNGPPPSLEQLGPEEEFERAKAHFDQFRHLPTAMEKALLKCKVVLELLVEVEQSQKKEALIEEMNAFLRKVHGAELPKLQLDRVVGVPFRADPYNSLPVDGINLRIQVACSVFTDVQCSDGITTTLFAFLDRAHSTELDDKMLYDDWNAFLIAPWVGIDYEARQYLIENVLVALCELLQTPGLVGESLHKIDGLILLYYSLTSRARRPKGNVKELLSDGLKAQPDAATQKRLQFWFQWYE